jgi:hypothetical protein
MSSKLLMAAAVFLCALLAGCTAPKAASCGANPSSTVEYPPPPEMIALHTATPLVIDGKLDEPIWKTAPAYQLLPMPDTASDPLLHENGSVRLAWDAKYLYLGAAFHDSDVVAEGKADNLRHYLLGDVCELFLKPGDRTWYWELYVTPAGRQTTFFFPGGGRQLPSCLLTDTPLMVAAQIQGTLNNWHDRDQGWTAEMAVPLSLLTAHGEHFGPGYPWRILIGRYNYSRYLSETELSSYPALSKIDFHRLKEYAHLRLQP